MRNLLFLASGFIACAAAGAVGDFTRTVISEKLNGWDGVQFIKWEKGSGTTAGRGWAVKVDLSKGYRLRPQFGDAKRNKARVGAMAETIADKEGVVPIMGMNADYFDVNVSYARCTGLLFENDALVTRGFTNANAAAMCYIAQLADGNLYHGPLTKTATAPSGCPTDAWQLTAGGKKIRQAVRTNYCNYPVKAGVMNPVANPISSGGATFPTTIGNMQHRTMYPRPLIGIGTNEVGVATNLVLFLNDGRQSGWSYHFPDVDAYQIMIDEGCSEVGEFDGGGSAAMWMADGPDSVYNIQSTSYKTAHGNYVNRPSDGAPRLDACGIFLMPPANPTYTVEVNDGNLYADLDAALAVVAPGDLVKVLGPTTLTVRSFPRSCTILCEDPVSAPITCAAGALSIPADVRVCFSNLAFTAAQTLSVASGGTAAVAGAPGVARVDLASSAALEIAGPLTADVVVSAQGASAEGDYFCTVSSVDGTLGASLAHLKNAANADLVAKAVSSGEAAGIRWAPSAATAVAGGLTAASYVQDGLVAQFDAIENTGVGVHDASAAKWKDLKGSASITVNSGATWEARGFNTSTVDHNITGLPALYPYSISVEVPVNVISNGARKAGENCWPRVWRAAERFDAHCSSGSSSQILLYVNGITTSRPAFGSSFRNGTMGAVSDTTNYRTYVNGVQQNTSGSTKVPADAKKLDSTWDMNGFSGYLHGIYRGLRFYNRGLTNEELAYNARIDNLRFFSFTLMGSGTASWAAASWEKPYGRTENVPTKLTNDFVRIVGAKVSVTAADQVGVKGLSLENGAQLTLASGAVAAAKVLYVGGTEVARGIYTGSGAFGEQVDWLAGEGVLYVAGDEGGVFPTRMAAPAADGWYEFGLMAADGGSVGFGSGYTGTTSQYHWMKGERTDFETFAFPKGAKLRLKGYVLIDTVPAGIFSEYDMSKLEYAELLKGQAFADGTTLVIPKGKSARFQGGTWQYDGGKWWLRSTSGAIDTFKGAIENNGVLRIYGDGTHVAKQTFTGDLSGNGEIQLTNFSNQGRFRGAWNGTQKITSMQNGNAIWVDTDRISGKMGAVTFGSCGGTYSTNASYCASGLLFGIENMDKRADNEFYIQSLNSQGQSITDPKGKRWRVGGQIIVWGSNVVHVGTLSSGLHVVSRRQDQHCNNNFYNGANGKGIGFLVVDKMTGGTLYGSTNIAVTIGNVASASVFDYTYEANNVNPRTLDITNGCNASASVKATDLGMLPARISGFTGSVTLTATTTKAYTIPMDFTQGTNALYNTVGCIGSGTLAAAPSTGSINATFPTTGGAVIGDYALARFTAGGARLKDWTVTLNGADVQSAAVGSGCVATVKKDDTGLWLAVRKSGLTFTLR